MRHIYRPKGITDSVTNNSTSIGDLQNVTKLVTNTTLGITLFQNVNAMYQSTHFCKSKSFGEGRLNNTITPTSTIDEETNITVAALANFDDIGGNAAATADVLGDSATGVVKVPLLDGEAKVAYYRGHPFFLRDSWSSSLHPTANITHTKQFLAGHSFGLNVVPSFNPFSQAAPNEWNKTFVYYDSNAAFNISANISVSLWFYPTDISTLGQTFRFLLYRRIDASNSFMICLRPSDSKIYVFTNEAAATVKLNSTGTVNMNAWNLIIFTYNPTTNALVIYLNNSSSSATPADALPAPYTANANMYIGGIPGTVSYRYTGYIDNFVFWTGKILTSTEAGNMWTHGTIV